MPSLRPDLQILVVEDNTGDFILIEDYLREQGAHIMLRRASTYEEAERTLEQRHNFDAILLDLTLPDAYGEKLVHDMVEIAGSTPIVVLTGFSDQKFGISALSMGVADYLLKDELNAYQLYKSIAYSVERKRIGNQLKKSEAKYHRLFHFSPLPMWVYDLETLSFLDVNEAAIVQYGFSKEEFLQMKLPAIWTQNNVGEQLDRIKQFKKFAAPYRGIVQHVKKSGELIFVEVQSDSIDFDGKAARLVLATDITEKTKAAKILQLSEQRFKALVQEGTDMIAILSPEGNCTYVSPTAESILGITVDQLIGKNAIDFVHEADKARVRQEFNRLEQQKSIHIKPFRIKDINNNNSRWIETKLTNLIHDPSVGGIVANSIEVTERLESENKIRESVERYNIVSKATNDVIWDYDLSTGNLNWNENIRSVLGYDTAQTTIAWWTDKLHPEESKRIIDKLDASINNCNAYWTDEYRFRCADGTYKYFFDRGFLIKDDNGRGIRMIGSMHDITRQKEEEHRLKLLESVITNASDAVMITEATPIDNPGPRIVYVNNAFTKMTGYSKNEVIGKSPRFLQGPLTSREGLNRIRKTLTTGEPCDLELINYKKSGEKFWLNMAIAPVADNTGKFTHFISIQRDVTERMNYIQAIEDQNERLKEIAWTQSHVVRAPLARIMGLIEILPKYESYEQIPKEVLHYILSSAHELDHIIRDIVLKTEGIYNPVKHET
ncbi:PAS domain S-box protein [Chryseolinea sp. H1M3-3]|uniref:PAS domain S-box protein n=1 Tax=Chryseolinea sp. H1M3-3 TaxID=3034144 RepID=UPI0023EA9E1B|nr:PAS domain S-box protein [Chryseolinea sp. H1M3-3]